MFNDVTDCIMYYLCIIYVSKIICRFLYETCAIFYFYNFYYVK